MRILLTLCMYIYYVALAEDRQKCLNTRPSPTSAQRSARHTRDSIKWNDRAEPCCSNKSTRVEYCAKMSTTCGNIIYIPETLQKHSNFSSKHVISLRLGQHGSQLFIYRFLRQIVTNFIQNLNPLIVHVFLEIGDVECRARCE